MNQPARPEILDRMSALADGLRSRILLVLESQELTVNEVCAVLQLPQSTVSRHLKTLSEAGWVTSRPDGTRRLYQMPGGDLERTTRRLWHIARPELGATATAEEDARRLQTVLGERRARSREFFAGAAGEWDQLRDDLFGRRFHLLALLGWIRGEWTLGDLGCGSGALTEEVASSVRKVVAVDGSETMLGVARERLRRFDNVEVRRGELEALPLEDEELDAATLVLVLHHLPEPARVLGEVARVLQPGGSLLIVDMLPHDRQEYQQEMGHVWMGFDRELIDRMVSPAGLRLDRFRTLTPERAAKGPTLFAATVRRDPARAPN